MNDINKQAPTPKSKVWIIDGDEAIRWVLKKTLQKMELAYQSFSTHQAFSQALASEVYPQLLIMDESMLDKVSDHAIPTLIMTSRGGLTNTIDAKAVQGEWVDYLTKPFDLEVTMVSIKRALRHNLVKHSNTSALTSVEIPPQLASIFPKTPMAK